MEQIKITSKKRLTYSEYLALSQIRDKLRTLIDSVTVRDGELGSQVYYVCDQVLPSLNRVLEKVCNQVVVETHIQEVTDLPDTAECPMCARICSHSKCGIRGHYWCNDCKLEFKAKGFES